MKIVIMGAGEVGKKLAIGLNQYNHQVTIIDTNQALLKDLEGKIDVMTVTGNGASATVLEEAGIENANWFIGVSNNDECNLIACAVAKQFDTQKTIARVRNEHYMIPERKYSCYKNSMNIDWIINPDEVAALELCDVLENPVALSVNDFANERLKLVGMKVTSDAPISNRSLKELPELNIYGRWCVACIVRDKEVYIARGGDTQILPGDEVYIIAAPDALTAVNQLGGVESRELHKVVIVGASRVSYYILERFKKSNTHIMLVEEDAERCQQFASEFEHAVVHNADATDMDFLTQELGIQEADGFISASKDDETNVLSALLAKQKGVKRVITMIRKPQYMPLLEHIRHIDIAINPRQSTINAILRYVQQGKHLSMATMAEDRAEAVEVEVIPQSPYIGRQLKENFLPQDILLGAIVRGDEVIIPSGEDALQSGDRVILIAKKKVVDKVDELFASPEKSKGFKKFMDSVTHSVSKKA